MASRSSRRKGRGRWRRRWRLQSLEPWDGEQIQHCQNASGLCVRRGFFPGRHQARDSGEGAVGIWNTSTWKPIRGFDGPTAPAQHIAFADQGKFSYRRMATARIFSFIAGTSPTPRTASSSKNA